MSSSNASLALKEMPHEDYLQTRSVDQPAFRVAIILVPGFALMSFSSVVEVLRSANRMSNRACYEWKLYGDGDGHKHNHNHNHIGFSVESNGGISVATLPLKNLAAEKIDLIVVCAASFVEQKRFSGIEAVVRRANRQGIPIAAVSTGSFVLGYAGLLDQRECTVHWDYAESFSELFPDARLCNDLFVIDGRILTCAGAVASLDMMLHLVRLHYGSNLAQQISDQFLHGGIRPPADNQQLLLKGVYAPNRLVRQAVEIMRQTIEEPISQRDLAGRLGVSQRHLERLTKEYLGTSPGRYYNRLRVLRARRMLRQTDFPVGEIAVACGFVSLSHFTKAYRRQFGCRPREDRKNV